VYNSIITADSGIAVVGMITDTIQLKKYSFNGNLIWDCKTSSLVNTPPKIFEIKKNILVCGTSRDTLTHRNRLTVEVANNSGSLIAQTNFVLNEDTGNVTVVSVGLESDSTAILNYSIAGSNLSCYLIVNYKGDSISSLILPAYTVNSFDNGNILCAVDSNKEIIVREYSSVKTLIYKYIYKPFDSLNVCKDIKPLPYPGRFVLTGSSNNNLLIVRQDTSMFTSTGKNLKIIPPSIAIYSNPNNGTFTLSLSNVNEKCNIEIYNVVGEKIYNGSLAQTQGDNTINLTGQPSGIYFYRVLKETGALVGSGKLIIEK